MERMSAQLRVRPLDSTSLVLVRERFEFEHEIIRQGSICETTAVGGVSARIVGRHGRLSRRVHGGNVSVRATAPYS